jgi:hypothetical protein
MKQVGALRKSRKGVPAFVLALVATSFIATASLTVGPVVKWSELLSEFQSQPLAATPTVLLWVALFGWPWIVAAVSACGKNGVGLALLFSICAPLISALFHSSISGAPTEGKGYYALFCVLAIWVSFVAIAAVLRRSAPKDVT